MDKDVTVLTDGELADLRAMGIALSETYKTLIAQFASTVAVIDADLISIGEEISKRVASWGN